MSDEVDAVIARMRPNGLDPPEEERAPSTWTPVPLDGALSGVEPPPPSILQRCDGLALVYPGRTHWFQGESESGKSWLAQLAVVDVIRGGGTVLYVDFEDDVSSVVARLLALALTPAQIADRFVYLHPGEPLEDARGRHTVGSVDLGTLLTDRRFDLAVIDGVTEAMTTEGLSLLDNADVARWLRRLPHRITPLGTAVICVDHVTKAREDRSRYAIGGAHKLNGLTGAAYTLQTVRAFGRSAGEPMTGVVLVDVVKDRPGCIRGRCPDGKVGVLKLTSWPDGGVTGHIEMAGTTTMPDARLIQAIAEYLLIYEGSTGRAIEDGVPGKGVSIRAALAWMAEAERGFVTVERVGTSHRHFLTDAGRALVRDE